MDRTIVYPGQVPLDTDILRAQQYAMAAFGWLAQGVFGSSGVAVGLAATPNSPADLSVLIGPGMVTSLTTLEGLGAYGTLAQNTTDPLVKCGINTGTVRITTAAPGTAGQSVNYLIQGQFSEADTGSTVLPYYNAANPSMPYAGPSNSGTSQNTLRRQTVTLQAKAGTPATTGTQTTPSADAGFVPLWVVTVANGQTSVTSGNIARASAAPVLPYTMAAPGGARRRQFFASSGTFTVPAGVTRIRAMVLGGGGGGGGAGGAGGAGTGGGAGGYAEKDMTVTPGAALTVTVGGGGTAGSNSGGDGTAGTASTFNGVTANGGGAGSGGVSSIPSPGPFGGTATGGDYNVQGQSGTAGATTGPTGGVGGGSFLAGITTPNIGSGPGQFGYYPGQGGCGGGGGTYSGGNGAGGVVVIEY